MKPIRKNLSFTLFPVLVGVLPFAFAACGKSSVNTVYRTAQTETSGGSGTGGTAGTGGGSTSSGSSSGAGSGAVTEAVTNYDGSCDNEKVEYFGSSRRYTVRLYPPGICPADQNEKTKVSCLKNFGFVLEKEFFVASDCKGARTAALVEFFTFPEAKGAADPATGAVAINATSGPVFLRLEETGLMNLFNAAQFCGLPWALDQNAEVSGKSCGDNDPFLSEKTPVYSLWKKTDPEIRFGGFATEESERPTKLQDDLVFKIR